MHQFSPFVNPRLTRCDVEYVVLPGQGNGEGLALHDAVQARIKMGKKNMLYVVLSSYKSY